MKAYWGSAGIAPLVPSQVNSRMYETKLYKDKRNTQAENFQLNSKFPLYNLHVGQTILHIFLNERNF
jgi:hypothetical protein